MDITIPTVISAAVNSNPFLKGHPKPWLWMASSIPRASPATMGSPIKQSSLIGFSLILLAALLFWATTRMKAPPFNQPFNRPHVARTTPRPEPLPPLGQAPRTSAASPITLAPPTVSDKIIDASPKDTRRVRGSVLADPDYLPVQGVDVQLYVELPASGLLFKTSSKTDTDGVVLFDIDSRILDGSICNVMVTRDRKQKLFAAPMTLRTDFTILIPKTITLRGRVLDVSPDRIGSIRFQELFQGDAHFLGQTTPDSTGYFECRSSPPTVPNDIQTTVTLRNGSSFIQSIRATDLLSSQGATIDLLIYDRNIQVSTTDDAPIEGASINVYGTSGSLFIHVITDAAGNAPISVNSDRVEYCVGHDGYSPVVGNLDPIDATGGWRVRLHPIGFSETIRGQVCYPNGQPASDAFVAATPRTDYPDVGSVGMCSSISDSDGEFSLPVGTSTDFVVTAYLASNGLSQPVIARSGATGIVLSLPDTGTIRISVDACTASDVTGASSVEYVVASVDTSYEDSGSVYSLPIVLEELDDGEYNVYIWCPGSDWYAEGLVEVTGGSVESYSLPCAMARYASGRVLDRDGRPIPDCLVRSDIDSWPDEAGNKWARSVTNSGGEFRFLVPNVHVVPIAVVYDGAVRERSQLVVGRSVDLVLGQ